MKPGYVLPELLTILLAFIPPLKSDGIAKVIYESKDGKTSQTFDALDWLAQLVTHIPNKGESAGGGSDIMDSTRISLVD